MGSGCHLERINDAGLFHAASGHQGAGAFDNLINFRQFLMHQGSILFTTAAVDVEGVWTAKRGSNIAITLEANTILRMVAFVQCLLRQKAICALPADGYV
jgi:hypothetical protein